MKIIYLKHKLLTCSITVSLLYSLFGKVLTAQEFKQQEKYSQQQIETDTLKTKGSANVQDPNDIVYPKRQSISNQQGSSKQAISEKMFIPVGDMKSTNTNVPTQNPIQPK